MYLRAKMKSKFKALKKLILLYLAKFQFLDFLMVI